MALVTGEASKQAERIVGSVSLGVSTGKTPVGATNQLASVAATANQVVATYTVSAGKTFYLEHADVSARLTAFAATATQFGTASLRINGVIVYTVDLSGTGFGQGFPLDPGEPIPVAAGVVIDWVCTPSAVTAMTWRANILGYEK